MNKKLFFTAFLLGALAIVWICIGFIGNNPLALLMTLLVGAVYLMGAVEVRQFRQVTTTLTDALARIPDPLPRLGDWLDTLHPTLQNPVRLRIEGERTGLPGLALTPYLVGLLVMLGMLGTFVGMVLTLNGAVFALEGTTDLQAMRAALAAPIKGLGHAFGTSVAGVAASAMLGLMSALSRRERMLAVQLLDTKIATVLQAFSFARQREQAFTALQTQAQLLPAVVDKLEALVTQMQGSQQQLGDRLLSNQAHFHSSTQTVYAELAGAVEKSLKESLADNTRAAGESVKPMVAAAMNGIADEARLMHQRMIDTTQAQLDELSSRFGSNAESVAQQWNTALARHENATEKLVSALDHSLQGFAATFEQRSSALLATVNEVQATRQADQSAADQQRLATWSQSLDTMLAALRSEWQQAGAHTLAQQQQICTMLEQTARDISAQAQASAGATLDQTAQLLHSAEELLRARSAADATWLVQHEQRMDQLAGQWRTELDSFRSAEAERGNAAVERLGELQGALTTHLATLGTALEAPIARLIETASEAPRAAADVIGRMREEMSQGITRDNQVLDERSRIMATLNTLLDAINHASVEQRSAIDALVATSADLLDRVGNQFTDKVGAESTRIADVAAHVTGSAAEVASLSESFGLAVQLFNESNDKLIGSLQRIEAAMDKSMARSDEQLAYYVAQAREIIDLSIGSQKEVVDDLRQLRQAQLAEVR